MGVKFLVKKRYVTLEWPLMVRRRCEGDNNNNNVLIYKAQLHKSAQSAVQLLRNAYKTSKT